MKTTAELQLRKIALVLTAIVVLQVAWSAIRLWLMPEPEVIAPAEDSLRVDDIHYATGPQDGLSEDLASRPLFWEGRQAYEPPQGPKETGAPRERARASTAIDKVELYGTYSGGGRSGIIVSYNGKVSRLEPGESIEDWEFTMLSRETAVFQSGVKRKILHLEHVVPKVDARSRPESVAAAARKALGKKTRRDSGAAAAKGTNPEAGATDNQNDKGE